MQLLQVGWSWHPSVLIGMALWTVAYMRTTGALRQRNRWGAAAAPWRAWAFHVGTLVGIVALLSPLDTLGDKYLFSAHMLQHLLLMYVAAACWVLGTPGWLVARILPRRVLPLVRTMTRPAYALAVFAGVTLGWHIPGAYALAKDHEWVHIIEHLMFIGAAMIAWWPILGPITAALPRPAAPIQMLYLFVMAMPCTLLGAILTFADRPLYGFYMTAPHAFGIDALDDQRLGGLLMWIPTHMILLVGLIVIAGKWLNHREASSQIPVDEPAS